MKIPIPEIPHLTLSAGGAGLLAVLLGASDAFWFHAFTISWDQGLITTGFAIMGASITYVAGVKTPPNE